MFFVDKSREFADKAIILPGKKSVFAEVSHFRVNMQNFRVTGANFRVSKLNLRVTTLNLRVTTLNSMQVVRIIK